MEDRVAIDQLICELNTLLDTGSKVDTSEIGKHGYTSAFKALFKRAKTNVHICSCPEEVALERQWLEFRLCTQLASQSALSLTRVNTALRNRTFLTSNSLSSIDILWALSLTPYMARLTCSRKEMLANLTRWFTQVCGRIKLPSTENIVKCKTALYS